MGFVVALLIVWTSLAVPVCLTDLSTEPRLRPDNRFLRIIRAHPIYLVARLLTPVFRYLFEDLS